MESQLAVAVHGYEGWSVHVVLFFVSILIQRLVLLTEVLLYWVGKLSVRTVLAVVWAVIVAGDIGWHIIWYKSTKRSIANYGKWFLLNLDQFERRLGLAVRLFKLYSGNAEFVARFFLGFLINFDIASGFGYMKFWGIYRCVMVGTTILLGVLGMVGYFWETIDTIVFCIGPSGVAVYL